MFPNGFGFRGPHNVTKLHGLDIHSGKGIGRGALGTHPVPTGRLPRSSASERLPESVVVWIELSGQKPNRTAASKPSKRPIVSILYLTLATKPKAGHRLKLHEEASLSSVTKMAIARYESQEFLQSHSCAIVPQFPLLARYRYRFP